MKYFVLLISIVFLISCTSEKKELYNIATDEVRQSLKSPSSAEFDDFDENLITITRDAGKGQPAYESLGKMA